MAEGAAQRFVWTIFFHVVAGLSPGLLSEVIASHSRPIFLRAKENLVAVLSIRNSPVEF
jgi:hypothetical protein